MRTLKFRFWKDKTIQGILELKQNNILDMGWEWDSVDQFTGLLDKQGKEIYEGDIVNWVNTDGEILSSQKISFDSENGCWCIGCISFERFLQSGYVNQHHLEIIGNIFENPEFIPK